MECQPPVHPAQDRALLFDLSAGIAAGLQVLQQFMVCDGECGPYFAKAATGVDIICKGRRPDGSSAAGVSEEGADQLSVEIPKDLTIFG
jgi:hypothetical protein